MIKLVDRSDELLGYVDKCLHPVYEHKEVPMVPSCYGMGGVRNTGKVINFYEWSDTGRTPLRFYTLEAFESYTRRSGITFFPFEADVIRRMLYDPHIACKRGDNRLVICSSFVQLCHVLNNQITLKI